MDSVIIAIVGVTTLLMQHGYILIIDTNIRLRRQYVRISILLCSVVMNES